MKFPKGPAKLPSRQERGQVWFVQVRRKSTPLGTYTCQHVPGYVSSWVLNVFLQGCRAQKSFRREGLCTFVFPGSGVGFTLCEGTLFKLKSLFFLMSTSSVCLCQYITYLWTTYPLKCFLLCTGKCSCRPGMQEQNDSWEEAQDIEEKKEGDRVQAQFTEEWVYSKKKNVFLKILEAEEEKVKEKWENHAWCWMSKLRLLYWEF